jgi:hypothetical protein
MIIEIRLGSEQDNFYKCYSKIITEPCSDDEKRIYGVERKLSKITNHIFLAKYTFKDSSKEIFVIESNFIFGGFLREDVYFEDEKSADKYIRDKLNTKL